MKTLLHIIVKDLKNVIYDRKSLVILIVMPIAIISILGISLQDMFSDEFVEEMDSLPIAVVKQYDSEKEEAAFKTFSSDMDLSTEMNMENIFFNTFLDNPDMREIIQYRTTDEEEAKRLLEKNEIVAAVYLPEGFIYNGYINFMTLNRNIIDIKVVVNPKKSIYGEIVSGIMESFVQRLNIVKARNGVLVGDLISHGFVNSLSEMISNVVDESTGDSYVRIEEESVTRQLPINSFQYYSVAIMCMFLLYAATFGARLILSERKEYTLARLRVSGIGVKMAVISNFVRICLISMLQSIVMITFSSIVLHVEWGKLSNLVVSIFLLSVTVGAFGMLLSILTLVLNNYKIANIFELVVIQFMALIGGSFIPVETLPDAIGHLNFLSVSGLGIKLYLNAMYNQPLLTEWKTIVILVAYIIALFIISALVLGINRKKVLRAC